jgi:hypothetical protein
METKSTKKAPAPESEGPVKVLRIEDVSVSIFARDRKIQDSTITLYSVSLSRSYKDSSGERKYTKNFDAEDLGKLVTLIQQASDFIRSQTDERAV